MFNKKKKVLLLNPPGEELFIRDQYCSFVSKASYLWPPIDLLVQSGILSQDFEVEVIDAIAKKMKKEECLERIKEIKPHGVFFLSGTASWRNDFFFLKQLKSLLPEVKLLGSGGNLFFNHKKIIRENKFIDAILLDFTSWETIDYFKGEIKRFNDISYREEGRINFAPFKRKKGYFSFPIPRHELFPIDKYQIPHAKHWPITRVMSNFGCPFSCRFCVSSQIPFRLRNIDNVINELKYIESLGIKEIDFTDQTFGAVRFHGEELCKKIIKQKINLGWICRTRVDVLNKEFLVLMKKAGCHAVNLGVESGDENLLRRYSKGIEKEQVRKVFKLCKKLGITTLAYFIIGLPGETEKTVLKTIEFAKELDPDFASFTVATPDYGTPLREEAIKKGWIDSREIDFDSTLSPVINTPLLSAKQAFILRRKAVYSFYLRPTYLIKRLFSLRSFRELRVLINNAISLLQKV
jgi:radical SAM superfamily enzyme YgiQ (UPF0313 family)